MSYKHGGAVGYRAGRLLTAFNAMHLRCENPSQMYFEHYGGRGITVCAQWSTYIPFRDWSLANGYAPDLTIDRIDVNGPYSPENCRWTDAVTQMNNTRRNHWVDAFGERKTIAQWTRDARCSVSQRALLDRLDKLGWSPEMAIATPLRAIKTGPKRKAR